MSRMLETISYLSRTIGPRPAGTEEEQQAALYLAEAFQQKANLSAVIDDFNCYLSPWISKMLAGLGVLLLSILAFIFPNLMLLWFVLTLGIGGIFIAESLGFSLVERFFLHGASQNVVARFEPLSGQEGRSHRRKRKVILVAHYDSGKVNALEQGFFLRYLPYAKRASVASFGLIPVFLLLKTFVSADSPLMVLFNCLLVLSLLGILFLLAEIALTIKAPYNEAANCNASGAAVLLEVAQRINQGKSDLQEEGSVGDLESAVDNVVTEESKSAPSLETSPEPTDFEARQQSPEERLVGAKAAIAALTGKSVGGMYPQDIAHNLVQEEKLSNIEFTEEQLHKQNQEVLEHLGGRSQISETEELSNNSASVDTSESSRSNEPVQTIDTPSQTNVSAPLGSLVNNKANVPDWYTRAQNRVQKPNVSRGTCAPIKRSRYSDALKAAEEESHIESRSTVVDTPISLQDENEIKNVQQELIVEAAEIQESVAQECEEMRSPDQVHDLDSTQAFTPYEDVAQELSMESEHQGDKIPASALEEPFTSQDDKIQALLNQSLMKDEEGTSVSKIEACAQPAPLAMAQEEDGQGAARSLLKTSLPDLSETVDTVEEVKRPEILLPSMSGTISAYKGNLGNQAVAVTGSFSAIQNTGSLSPVGDELVADMDPDERYVFDADDSDFDEGFTESGAYAGPDYVEMPQSRFKQFFAKFMPRKTKISQEESTYEWLDVDEDFEARKVGAERKTWESFRSEEEINGQEDEAERTWHGGAINLNGEFAPTKEASLEQDLEDFRYGVRIDKEVWFVALGSQCESDLGMKNFIRTYAHDLKGAVIVNIEGLGRGDLSFISAEGELKVYKPSSRMNRLLKKVSRNCGLTIGDGQILWKNSSATQAMKARIPAMSLVGMDKGAPALYAQGGDVIESLDALTLENNADFIVELIKNV